MLVFPIFDTMTQQQSLHNRPVVTNGQVGFYHVSWAIFHLIFYSAHVIGVSVQLTLSLHQLNRAQVRSERQIEKHLC